MVLCKIAVSNIRIHHILVRMLTYLYYTMSMIHGLDLNRKLKDTHKDSMTCVCLSVYDSVLFDLYHVPIHSDKYNCTLHRVP